MSNTNTSNTTNDRPQFIVLPKTGMQICREIALPASVRADFDTLKKFVDSVARTQAEDAIVQLVNEHAACDCNNFRHTNWISVDQRDRIFFRLVEVGSETQLELLVDTTHGAGAQNGNRVPITLQDAIAKTTRWIGSLGSLGSIGSSHELGTVYVEDHLRAGNVPGSLIVDFGNSGTCFVFSKEGGGPKEALLVENSSAFDPNYHKRKEREILPANMVLLRAEENNELEPWLVVGERAKELIKKYPSATYMSAPKKYVRDWAEHLKHREPTLPYRGVQGGRDGLHDSLGFVELTLKHMFQTAMACLTNPEGMSLAPRLYPQVARVMLTYPLTWRKSDQDLFKEMVTRISDELFVHDNVIESKFSVELVCSEPVAVAAFALWEQFYHFDRNLALATSTLGNLNGKPELRMLVVDMGGGSTDIACVDVNWEEEESDASTDVYFKMIESMRFNRAGDRLTHIFATSIMSFLSAKYGIDDTLSFDEPSSTRAFTRVKKRQSVSRIFELSEEAKIAVIAGETWRLSQQDEEDLLAHFDAVTGGVANAQIESGPHYEVTIQQLEEWVQADRQCSETEGEPGFMDIFLYLEELTNGLRKREREPNLIVLSGRTSRIPFIRNLVAEHTGLPLHRVRTLADLLPDQLKVRDYNNIDKLAVALGAQRFRFGDNIRFKALESEAIFNRYIGTVRDCPHGLRINDAKIKPGDATPASFEVTVQPEKAIRIGHAFREQGVAQVIATLSNQSATEPHTVTVRVCDDYSVELESPNGDVLLTEWVPGGNELIIDNFNDTGDLDRDPDGFLQRIVEQNRQEWVIGEQIAP